MELDIPDNEKALMLCEKISALSSLLKVETAVSEARKARIIKLEAQVAGLIK